MEKRLDRINDDISLYQYTEGFAYGTDAVLLADFIKIKKGDIGVELGTGTGIIPILVTYNKAPSKIYAFEIQEDYASLARENVEMNGMSDRIEVLCDDLKNITPSYLRGRGVESADFVFTNPPYMKSTSGKLNESERKLIARHEIHCDINDVCRAASRILKNGGDFFVIYRPDRLCDLFVAMRDSDIEPKEMTEAVSKAGGEPSLVLVRGKRSAASSMKINEQKII